MDIEDVNDVGLTPAADEGVRPEAVTPVPEAAPPEPAAEPKSVRDTIKDAMSAAKAKDGGERTVSERPRDQSGRFARKEDAPAAPLVAQGAPPPAPATPDTAAPPAPTGDAPAWLGSPEEKAAWASAPAALRAAVEREAAATNEYVQSVNQVLIGPLEQAGQVYGLKPVEALNHLLSAHQMLTDNPVEGLISIGERFGLGDALRQFFSTPEGEQPAAGANPEVVALRHELQQLKTGIAAENNARMRREASTEWSRFAAGKSDIDVFRPTMAELLRTGKANDYQSAYAMARQTFDPLVQKAVADSTEAAKRAEQNRVAKARAASVSLPTSPGSPERSATPAINGHGESVRDTLKRTIAQLQS